MSTAFKESFCEFVFPSKAFGQFDVDGEGYAEVAAMLETLKSSNGANLKGELTHVIRTLQTCSLTPGQCFFY